ncbi:MAG: peptidoglycan DD-metalloendopeptidase family protein, partial [Candidatus Eisenbacteria bacterium]|nr:peptidoglycan DD-metalloendopeptidase family protein [Candidatus Latescibacterota bacterium]MBD3303246.1 peptidoglycan DD-metalloendopeptidase family protein [Candidatus Eisenbacteria bacterium]
MPSIAAVPLVLILSLIATPSLGAEVREFAFPDASPCLSEGEWLQLRARAELSIARLTEDGALPPPDPSAAVSFDWPLRASADHDAFGYHTVFNFVDHDPDYPDRLLDYECGTRSYDTTNGVNHNGTDYIPWPFWWWMMDNDRVEIVAAAGGTIIDKRDGYDDRSCTPGGTANMVAIQHADGTRAWYLHMKTWSVTPKAIGETVETGELLGLIGSSGSSTVPHLHFDVRDVNWNTFDPYAGPCNDTVSASWWIEQRPYYDSAINAIYTHGAPPEFPECPQQEILNLRDSFAPGEAVFYAIYHRDLVLGQVARYEVRRPDDSIAQSGMYSIEDPFY